MMMMMITYGKLMEVYFCSSIKHIISVTVCYEQAENSMKYQQQRMLCCGLSC